MNKRCLPFIISLTAVAPVLTASEAKAPRAEVVEEQKASPSRDRLTAADLELVQRVFATESARPMDWGRKSSGADKVVLSESGVAWQSYWWDGANALYNTSGLVITGSPDFSEKWKPFALIGLEDQVTFERHGKKRQGHIGLGIEYRLNDTVGLFTEFRAVATSGLPTEGIARAGIHLLY